MSRRPCPVVALAAGGLLTGCAPLQSEGLSSLLGTSLALTLVLGLAYGVLWGLRQLQPTSRSDGELRFVRALPLGARERLVTVVWRDEVLLIGVTSASVTLIHRSAEAEPEEDIVGDFAPPLEDMRDRILRAAGRRHAVPVAAPALRVGAD